ncbi:hypothetical protein KSS87_016693 [Heliosperma pusillum]|nr:hypothetical protein KSS87_000686 [Heliosperma pusillum]KAH9622946.1 hypothetical protein KSS87_016693 [Heliosperma pusillum]
MLATNISQERYTVNLEDFFLKQLKNGTIRTNKVETKIRTRCTNSLVGTLEIGWICKKDDGVDEEINHGCNWNHALDIKNSKVDKLSLVVDSKQLNY